jgi:hypothetical protein
MIFPATAPHRGRPSRLLLLLLPPPLLLPPLLLLPRRARARSRARR